MALEWARVLETHLHRVYEVELLAPLCTTRDEIDEIVGILAESVEAVS